MTITSIYLVLTPNCNLRCKYCFQENDYHGRSGDVASVAVIDEFVEFCVKHEVHHVELFGGEPLLHKDRFIHAVQALRKRTPNTSVGVVTNGTLIDEDIMRLLEAEPISVLLSLDGPKERHDRFRGGFDKISPWFDRLAALDRVTIAMQASTADGLYDGIRFCWESGFRKGVYINVIQNKGWYAAGDVAQFEIEYERAVQGMLRGEGTMQCVVQFYHILKKSESPQGCGITSQGLASDRLGRLYPCHRAMELGEAFAIGDLRNGIDEARAAEVRGAIHEAAFGSEAAHSYPMVSYCPVTGHHEHGRFDGPWPAEFCEMIEIKAKLVSKYFHDIDALMAQDQ